MAYPLTGSTLNSQISTGLSTQILVKVEGTSVGAIQRLQISHTRNLQENVELGNDGILEIVPRSATTYQATINRIVFDRLSLPEAFKRGFMNIKSQLLGFDIEIIDRSNGDTNGLIVHTLENCWFSSLSVSYQADNFIISQDATVKFEDIRSNLGTSQASAVIGGARGIVPQTDTFGRETATDSGAGGSIIGAGFRGTMDTSNLTNAVFEE